MRIASTLPNVSFRTPTGQFVLMVLNDGAVPQSFNIGHHDRLVAATLSPGTVGTYTW